MVNAPQLGWICPLCHHGVAPTVNVCPCKSSPLGVLPQVPEPLYPFTVWPYTPTTTTGGTSKWVYRPTITTDAVKINAATSKDWQALADYDEVADAMLLSEPVLRREWDTPEEDEAWKILTPDRVQPVEEYDYE